MSELKKTIEEVLSSPDFKELTADENLLIDLKYATTDNFVGRNMYQEFNRAFLHQVAYQKFLQARDSLKAHHPEYKFIIFDALRPHSIQKILWNEVKDTPLQIYIADPARGSVHNYGLALDLSILDENGQELDMGTPFDSFQPLAQPQLQPEFEAQGILKTEQIANRKLLRETMSSAGFTQLPTEWWHFDALPREQIRAGFKMVL